MNLKKVLFVCALTLAIVLSGCGKAPAAAPKEDSAAKTPAEVPTEAPKEDPAAKALSAYQELLKAAPAIEGEPAELVDASFNETQNREKFGSHYEQFALADLDQDGIPELIALSVVNFRWVNVSVFTFAEGRAVLLQDPLNPSESRTFEQNSAANGAYLTYICEENHIHSVWRGTTPVGDAAEENSAYTLSGTTLAAVGCTAGENEKTIYVSDIAKANTPENVAAMVK